MITEEKAKDIFYNVAFKEKTYKEISEELGVHISTLCHHMKKFKPIFGINEKNITMLTLIYVSFIKKR